MKTLIESAQLLLDGPFLVQTFFGTTAILTCAVLAVVVLGARSAALRHRIWTLSMIAVLLFPAFAVLLPSFGPQWPRVSTARGDSSATHDRPNLDEKIPDYLASELTNHLQPKPHTDGIAEPANMMERGPSQALVGSHRESASLPLLVERSIPEGEQREFTLGNAFIAVWLLGLLCRLLVLVKSQRWAARVVRRAIPVTSRSTLQLGEQLCKSAAIRVPVPILLSSDVAVPMTFACFRPVIVLPIGYGKWTTERCRAVLAHELAHIRRRDVLSQLIAQLVSIIYWYQPLVWLANWRMRVEREFACDDAVLYMGESPREYANHLVEVAAALIRRSCQSKSAVAIASKGGLEHRISAILHPRLHRAPVDRVTGRILSTAALAIVVVSCVLSPCKATHLETRMAPAGMGEITSVSSDREIVRPTGIGQLASRQATSGFPDNRGRDLVLRFPPDRAIGVVYIQDHDKDIRQEPQRWAYARGNVRVPLGKKLRLDISAAARRDLSPLRQLPPNSLHMLAIREADLDDAALASIGNLTGLKSILLYCCRIDDEAARHFAKFAELEVVNLGGSTISDVGLAQLGSLGKLVELDLSDTRGTTDRGMPHVAKLTSLTSLNLTRTQVSDSGLSLLKDLVHLRSLNLGSMKFVSDAGMANLAALTRLRELDLSCYSPHVKEPIGDRGLAHLVSLKQLKRLILSGTAVTDSGLAHLESLSSLEELSLPSGPSEAALEGVGRLSSLRRLSVSITMASDSGLSHLIGLQNLEHLNLWCTPSRVTDRAVEHIRQMKRLKSLALRGSAIADDGLRSLAQLSHLEDLRLHDNRVTFEGLRHLQQFPSLRQLSFSRLKGRRGSLRHLRQLPRLKRLEIGHNPQLGVDAVGMEAADEGLAYLSAMTGLERLSLSSIAVTDEGIRHLSDFKSLKALHLANDRNLFTDEGLEFLVDLKKLEVLLLRGSITDRGLIHLAGLESLQTTSVQGRPWGTISDSAMEELSNSLPSMNKVYNFWRPRT